MFTNIHTPKQMVVLENELFSKNHEKGFFFKALSYFFFSFLAISLLKAQNIGDYNRIGITIVSMSQPDGHLERDFYRGFSSLKIPGKFDDNMLSYDNTIMRVDSATAANPLRTLQASQIANKAIDRIFNEKNGRWSMDRLFERARYNLTDAEFTTLQAQFKEVDRSVQDAKWVEPIIKNSFIVVLNYHHFQTLEEMGESSGSTQIMNALAQNISKNPDAKVEARKGYGASVTAKVYQIKIDDAVLNEIYTNCWADASSTEEEVRRAVENRKRMSYTLIDRGTFSPVRPRSGVAQDNFNGNWVPIFADIAQKGLYNAVTSIERGIPEFQVRTSVFGLKSGAIKKVTAKIGSKEGLANEDRFYVYEQVQKGNGKIVLRQRGTVRASSVASNIGNAKGEASESEFVQVSGTRLDKGMLLQQKPDLLGGFSGGLFYGSLGLNLRAEFLISKFGSGRGLTLYGELTGKDYNDLGLSNVRIVTQEDEKTFDAKARYGSFALGLAKEINIARNFMIQPYVGMRFGKFSFADLDSTVSSSLQDGNSLNFVINGESYRLGYSPKEKNRNIDLGVRLGISLGPKVRLIGGVGFSPAGTNTEGTIFDERLPGGAENPYYLQRSPMVFEAGLRIIP